MTALKKRAAAALILTFAMLLAATVCLYLGREAPATVQAGAAMVADQPDPITRFRTEREELRSRQEGQLNDIIHSANADGETVSLAQRQLMNMMAARDAELRLEGILKIRGFSDALVTCSADSVNVIVRAEALTRRDTALILDLVLRETGVTAGNVKILSINL